MGYTVLIFEDDITMVRSLLSSINWAHCNVSHHLTADNVKDGWTLFETHKIDLVICDVEVINGTGFDLLKQVRINGYETEFIFLTNYAEFSYAQEVLKLQGNDYILKTDSLEVLERAIECSVARIRGQNSFSDTLTTNPKQTKNDNNYIEKNNHLEIGFDSHLEEWKQYLLDFDKINLLGSIKTFFDKAQKKSSINCSFLMSFQNSFIQMTYQTSCAQEVHKDLLFDNNLSIELYRKASLSVFDMMKWLNNYIDRAVVCLDKQDNNSTLIDKAKSFIHYNYMYDINRQNIASAICVNSDYLSRLFNKQVEISIPEYIAGVRIEHAIHLMHTDLHVSNIALEVGVDNFSYFSKTFKKFTGMSPTDYKKSLSS